MDDFHHIASLQDSNDLVPFGYDEYISVLFKL